MSIEGLGCPTAKQSEPEQTTMAPATLSQRRAERTGWPGDTHSPPPWAIPVEGVKTNRLAVLMLSNAAPDLLRQTLQFRGHSGLAISVGAGKPMAPLTRVRPGRMQVRQVSVDGRK